MDDGAGLILQLIIQCVLGAIAAGIANSKGRSTVGWFFGGFFLGLIGIIIVACLSNVNEEQARQQRDAEEKRRLREQLRQEQLKSESYRQYTMERLDAHDSHLGIDTRETKVSLPGGSPVTAPAKLNLPGSGTHLDEAPPPMDIAADPSSEWYYSNNQTDRSGPYSLGELQQLYAAGEVDDQTLVWSESLADWTTASLVPELKRSNFS